MFDKASGVVKSEKSVTIKIPSIEKWPISHLRRACRKNKIKGYTKMSRDELVVEVKKIIANFNKQ